MAFFLKHKAFGYKQYMQLKKSKGICFGLASYWILDIASGKKKDLTPVSHLNSTAFEFQGVYEIVEQQINSDRVIFETLGKQVSSIEGVTYSVHMPSFSIFGNDTQLKNRVSRIPGESESSILCLLGWKLDCGGGHAVVIFKNKNDKNIYFYDPNDGVYKWCGFKNSIYDDIKEKISKDFSSNTQLGAILFVRSRRNLMPIC